MDFKEKVELQAQLLGTLPLSVAQAMNEIQIRLNNVLPATRPMTAKNFLVYTLDEIVNRQLSYQIPDNEVQAAIKALYASDRRDLLRPELIQRYIETPS